jgi:hypothetical protein
VKTERKTVVPRDIKNGIKGERKSVVRVDRRTMERAYVWKVIGTKGLV